MFRRWPFGGLKALEVASVEVSLRHIAVGERCPDFLHLCAQRFVATRRGGNPLKHARPVLGPEPASSHRDAADRSLGPHRYPDVSDVGVKSHLKKGYIMHEPRAPHAEQVCPGFWYNHAIINSGYGVVVVPSPDVTGMVDSFVFIIRLWYPPDDVGEHSSPVVRIPCPIEDVQTYAPVIARLESPDVKHLTKDVLAAEAVIAVCQGAQEVLDGGNPTLLKPINRAERAVLAYLKRKGTGQTS